MSNYIVYFKSSLVYIEILLCTKIGYYIIYIYILQKYLSKSVYLIIIFLFDIVAKVKIKPNTGYYINDGILAIYLITEAHWHCKGNFIELLSIFNVLSDSDIE